MKGLKDKRWIELGWTDKAHDIINAADIFILPNKETYFDLVLLEVMSIGKPVVLTYTGGNKYFKNFKDSGLFFYDYNNIDSAIEQINKIKKSDIQTLGEKNKMIFNENFTISIFTKRYIQLLEKINNTN